MCDYRYMTGRWHSYGTPPILSFHIMGLNVSVYYQINTDVKLEFGL